MSVDKSRANKTIKEGEVAVEPVPIWISKGLTVDDSMRYFNVLTRFYIVQTVVDGLSSKGITLSTYGWNNPWSNPEYLNRKLKGVTSNAKLYFSVNAYTGMEGALAKAGLTRLDEVIKQPKECAVFYNSKKNQTLSLLAHIRNSLCHGRFCVLKKKRCIWFIFEDVSTDVARPNGEKAKKLSARIVLKYTTLTKWQELVRQGPGT